MTQAKPNPIELYEAAVHLMQPIIAGVKPSQLTATTPCTEWNVQAVLNHNIKVAQWVQGLITAGPAKVNPMEVSGALPREGAAAAFSSGTAAVLAALKGRGTLEKVITTPFGQMPVGQFIMFPMLDIVIHKWDLAKGTNQNASLDASLSQACYNVLQMGVEQGRKGGVFGPEVKVPISASIQNKILALGGRKP
jgi:uncharacterized protein (TIGR03086 family)